MTTAPSSRKTAKTTCESPAEWLAAVQGCEGRESIRSGLWSFTTRPRTSASKFNFQDYLSLRVLWKSRLQPYSLRQSGIFTKTQLDEADKRLANFRAYQTFLAHLNKTPHTLNKRLVDENNAFLTVHFYLRTLFDISEKPADDEAPAVFFPGTPVRYRTRAGRQVYEGMQADQLATQMQTLDISGSQNAGPRAPETPVRGRVAQDGGHPGVRNRNADSSQSSLAADAYPHTHGEYVTNCALLLLLQTLTLGDSAVSGHWSVDRTALEIPGIFVALTDGFLQRRSDDKPAAIVECKAYVRGLSKKKIRWQESAQISGYIHNHPSPEVGDLRTRLGRKDGKRRRFSIAQNHLEIYIIVSEFTDKYVRYLQESPDRNWEKTDADHVIDDESFLVQNTYGPFVMHNPAHVHELSAMFVALSRMQSE